MHTGSCGGSIDDTMNTSAPAIRKISRFASETKGIGSSMKLRAGIRPRAVTQNGSVPADYVPSDDEPFMNERQKAYFRAKLVTWKNDILREARETLGNPAARKRESPGSRRPCVVRNRPGNRASRSRPAAQADSQDRIGAAAHRGRDIRLLRGDRRADRAEASRRPADRNPVDRGAGAPRAPRKGLSRRLRIW